ncbi:hypothetical protein J2753_002651 [Halolamina salifodinae]|uniref:Uncharacterized protein n=1 Tax=Halolamina salifodinae TaxID=1202767 RepID=A0A8T4GYP0_9EURY|nr:hypothetical protein [Halolamina salifodinae]
MRRHGERSSANGTHTGSHREAGEVSADSDAGPSQTAADGGTAGAVDPAVDRDAEKTDGGSASVATPRR